jgi:D-cysteine desulfhydrase family pyridoxal phosphate-dependent enzyme
MKNIPRLRFAHLPTPVEPLPRLSNQFEGYRLLVKRDDQTGLALGGNKTRKLEFLLAEASANGAKTLITTGAVQSNHCRQTAAAAVRFGYDCILVLTIPDGEDIHSYPSQSPSGNLLIDQLFGAELVWAERSRRDQVLQAAFQAAWDGGRRPFLIPYGGSSPNGACAYVFAMQELLEQGIDPDTIIIPSSSGGTQAGLVVGARLFGYQGQILGISVDERAAVLKQRVAGLATRTADYLSENVEFSPDDIHVNEDYQWAGYGVLGAPEEAAIRTFAQKEGLLLDPVYTGRAAAGMIDLIKKGSLPAGTSILFWHTGGIPALFADRYRKLASP